MGSLKVGFTFDHVGLRGGFVWATGVPSAFVVELLSV